MPLSQADRSAILAALNAVWKAMHPPDLDRVSEKPRNRLLRAGQRLTEKLSVPFPGDPLRRYFERSRFDDKTSPSLELLHDKIALGGSNWPVFALTRTAYRAELRELLDTAMKALGQRRGPKTTNEARDAWVAKLRECKPPVAWEEIYRQLLDVAPSKGGNMPKDAKALSEAYRRRLKNQRTSS
jgi:hypothetical protein